MENLVQNLELSLIIYIAFINIISLGLFAWDKKRARSKSWRISENALLLVSFLGGSLGGLLAMNLFRHKTQKLKFRLGLPILLVLNIVALIFLMNHLAKFTINSSPLLQLF